MMTTSSKLTGGFQCEKVLSLTISSELSLYNSSCDRQTDRQTCTYTYTWAH